MAESAFQLVSEIGTQLGRQTRSGKDSLLKSLKVSHYFFFFFGSKPCVLWLLLINPVSIYNLTIFALPFDSFVRILFLRHFLVFWKYFFLAFESNFVLVLIKRYSIFCLLLINRVSICNVTIFALPFGLFVFVRVFFFRHFLVF